MHENATSTDPKTAPASDANGTSEEQAKAAGADEARRQAMQRAEELVDRWGAQVGHYFSAVGHSILKWSARAREEAEDIWAEAQAIRQRQRSQNP
jgi:hypothetical protein